MAYAKKPAYIIRQDRKTRENISLVPFSENEDQFLNLIENAVRQKQAYRIIDIRDGKKVLYVQEKGVTKIDLENLSLPSIDSYHEKVFSCLNSDQELAGNLIEKYSQEQIKEFLLRFVPEALKPIVEAIK